jgi:hypothetical protein
MPYFDFHILSMQMLMFNFFGIPELMTVLGGVPAFVIAAAPSVASSFTRFYLLAAASVALILGIGLLVRGGPTLTIPPMLIVLPTVGIALGLLIRQSQVLWRDVLAIALVLPAALGAIMFLMNSYGQNNCWP